MIDWITIGLLIGMGIGHIILKIWGNPLEWLWNKLFKKKEVSNE